MQKTPKSLRKSAPIAFSEVRQAIFSPMPFILPLLIDNEATVLNGGHSLESIRKAIKIRPKMAHKKQPRKRSKGPAAD